MFLRISVYRRMILVGLTGLLVATCSRTDCGDRADGSAVRGKYLGQKAPGRIPQPFAPAGLPIAGVQHCFPTFDRDGKEVYWMDFDLVNRKGVIMTMKIEQGCWTSPQVAPFSGEHNDHSPVFSRDGQRLYFVSNRPGGYGRGDIWFLERTAARWSEPRNLGSPPNSEKSDIQPSFTRDGTLYFTSELEGSQWNLGIYRSQLVDGRYQPPEVLDSLINTAGADYTPFIAPDESYLLFASSRPGTRSVETDLYISFHNNDDSWTPPINMGEAINNGYSVSFPWLSLDEKFLFFDRFNDTTDAFYWVDSRVIDDLQSD